MRLLARAAAAAAVATAAAGSAAGSADWLTVVGVATVGASARGAEPSTMGFVVAAGSPPGGASSGVAGGNACFRFGGDDGSRQNWIRALRRCRFGCFCLIRFCFSWFGCGSRRAELSGRIYRGAPCSVAAVLVSAGATGSLGLPPSRGLVGGGGVGLLGSPVGSTLVASCTGSLMGAGPTWWVGGCVAADRCRGRYRHRCRGRFRRRWRRRQ